MKALLCSVNGCYRKHYAKGLCNRHWAREQYPEKYKKVTATLPEYVSLSVAEQLPIKDVYENITYATTIVNDILSKFEDGPRKDIFISRFLYEESLAAIGKRYGISGERIRQLSKRILTSAQHLAYKIKLQDDYELKLLQRMAT